MPTASHYNDVYVEQVRCPPPLCCTFCRISRLWGGPGGKLNVLGEDKRAPINQCSLCSTVFMLVVSAIWCVSVLKTLIANRLVAVWRVSLHSLGTHALRYTNKTIKLST